MDSWGRCLLYRIAVTRWKFPEALGDRAKWSCWKFPKRLVLRLSPKLSLTFAQVHVISWMALIHIYLGMFLYMSIKGSRSD